MITYDHVRCSCNGIISILDKRGFICEKCQKEYSRADLEFDILYIKPYTGYKYPMIAREEKHDI